MRMRDGTDGATVLWGFSSKEELSFLDDLSPCMEPILVGSGGSGGKEEAEELGDSEFMLYEMGGSSGGASGGEAASRSSVVLKNNLIRLGAASESEDVSDVYEKLAISFAFAQSAKLAVFEAALEKVIEQIRPIPVELAASGRSRFTVNELSRLTGQVFLERNTVNLYSNILDTPEFFWEAEEYLPLYVRVDRYLDVDDRVEILNKRLDIVNDLLDSLSDQLEIRNSHRLEIIIIGLITVEIVMELVKESFLPPFVTWPRRLLALLVPWRSLR